MCFFGEFGLATIKYSKKVKYFIFDVINCMHSRLQVNTGLFVLFSYKTTIIVVRMNNLY